jgi:polyisoprenoid-binding protein YceI
MARRRCGRSSAAAASAFRSATATARQRSFSDWSGSITFDPDHPETADIRIQVKLASASLGDATQDEMLQGGDFFASSANPTATWRATSVSQTGPGRYPPAAPSRSRARASRSR